MRTRIIAGIGFFTAILATSSPVHAAGCNLDGIKLSCGDNDAAVFSALASDETAKKLSDPLGSLGNFKKPSHLEAFRKSVEKNWAAVNRVERRERRKMRSRQISASEFSDWTKGYNAALKNYGAALNFYRTLVWHGKTGKAAPKDD